MNIEEKITKMVKSIKDESIKRIVIELLINSNKEYNSSSHLKISEKLYNSIDREATNK